MTARLPGGIVRARRLTILLVDTQDDVRRAARKAFEREGFRVVEARGGGHALRLCEYFCGQVDALVTEVAIPHPNGVAIAEAVRAWWPRAAVLFIGDGIIAALNHGLHAPTVRHVLRRPVPVEQLVEATCRALGAR